MWHKVFQNICECYYIFSWLVSHALIEGLWVMCLVQGHVWLRYRKVTAFLDRFLPPEQRSRELSASQATTYHLQTFQLLRPHNEILLWDPVHLQSTRASCYCTTSIDVPSDITITDAGHASKVLNHPASWFVPQVLLSSLPWIHIMEAPHRYTHRL